MNLARQLSQREYWRLKDATSELVQTLGGPVAAKQFTRLDPARLSRAGNRHEAMFAGVDVIADLESEKGEPVVTRVLADLCGFDLVPRTMAAVTAQNLSSHLCNITAAAADLMRALAEVAPASSPSGARMDRIDEFAAELQARVVRFRQDLKHSQDAGQEAPRVVTLKGQGQ